VFNHDGKYESASLDHKIDLYIKMQFLGLRRGTSKTAKKRKNIQ